MGKRNIVVIDEDKCNGCGLCVAECHYQGTITIKETIAEGKTAKKAVYSGAQT